MLQTLIGEIQIGIRFQRFSKSSHARILSPLVNTFTPFAFIHLQKKKKENTKKKTLKTTYKKIRGRNSQTVTPSWGGLLYPPQRAHSVYAHSLYTYAISCVLYIIIIMTQSHSPSRTNRFTLLIWINISYLWSDTSSARLHLFIHSLELSYGAVDKPSTAEGRTSSLAQSQSV